MTEQQHTPPVTEQVMSMFDDLEEVAGRVRQQAAAELEVAESESPDSGGDRATVLARASVLQDGARGLEKLAKDPAADLAPDEQLGLEAIVLLVGRPALLVQHGDFPALDLLPAGWAHLEQQRQAIRDSILRVGRGEVSGHPHLDWVGTGFLVAPDLVMTNRQVANEFARRDLDGWSFQAGRAARWDTIEEQGATTQHELTVTEIVGIHDADDVDLAILRIEPGDGLPAPLHVMWAEPDEVVGRPVYVVGYPAWDGRRNDPVEMSRIFADVYNVKRLQPGVLVTSPIPTVLRHDCSTLGGNSGSPVFDLATHQVVGLHFGGRYLQGNSAVPLWRLADDPLVGSALGLTG